MYETEDYEKLATWALGIIINHQLSTASLIGVAEGLMEVMNEHQAKGLKVNVADKIQFTVLNTLILKRKEEVETYSIELNKLHVPLPEIDYGKLNEKADAIVAKFKLLAIGHDRNGINDTLSKLKDAFNTDKVIPDEQD